jgi:glyoxylase-like metal-dependent hydrolase (beta-lactamase superfamily II)
MLKIQKFTFNPFQENTYVLYDDSQEAVIVDPGCYETFEEEELTAFIESKNLKPVKLINTHFHLDHILGNQFVAKKYDLKVEGHKAGLPTYQIAEPSANMYGFGGYKPSPAPQVFWEEGDVISFGGQSLEVLFVPGHAPGHIALVHHESKSVINGDVLFAGGIGRTDLPGGDFDTLVKSIQQKMYKLPDDYKVYCGHGPETTIGTEKQTNAFVKAE